VPAPNLLPAVTPVPTASRARSLQRHGRRRLVRERLAPATVPEAPVPATTPSQHPRACPVPAVATAIAPVGRVRETTRLHRPRACRVRVDAATMSAAPAPQPVQADPVLPLVQAGPVRVHPVRAHRVPVVPVVPVVLDLLRA
jgi:hypothetical protein